MARKLHRLSHRKVTTITKPGRYSDGHGLYLLVREGGAKYWLYRYQRDKKERDMGLGTLSALSLAQARERAAEARTLLADGKDPLIEKAVRRGHGAKLWGKCVEDYRETHKSSWKGAKEAGVFTQRLKDFGPDWTTPASAVDTALVISKLRAVWMTKTETARKVRSYIERVWDAAKVEGCVSGENPARWKGHLDKLLAKPSKVAKTNPHPALPYGELRRFLADLRKRDAPAARAAEFAILTAARSGEVRLAQWSEFDLKAKTWTVPAARMKASREHRVPLSSRALAILKKQPKEGAFVFPGPSAPKLSDAAITQLIRRMHDADVAKGGEGYVDPKQGDKPVVLHGFRSTFRDWAAIETGFSREVIELSLAHAVKGKQEGAYWRDDALDKRRDLMKEWDAFCKRK